MGSKEGRRVRRKGKEIVKIRFFQNREGLSLKLTAVFPSYLSDQRRIICAPTSKVITMTPLTFILGVDVGVTFPEALGPYG